MMETDESALDVLARMRRDKVITEDLPRRMSSMLCTNCSRVVKPVVAVDIDGTLGDYHGHFIRFAEEYLPASQGVHPTYDGSEPFKVWGQRVWNIDYKTWNEAKLAYRQGGMKRVMPLFEWAPQMCASIRDAGAELWLTTTRPHLRLDGVDPDTRSWLDRHGIMYDHLMYDEDKYERLAELVDRERVVAVVDDLPEMIEVARRVYGWKVPILRKNYHNRSVSYADESTGSDDLKVITDAILRRIAQWKEAHA